MTEGYRWSGKYTANTSPRMARYRIDLAAIDDWNRRNVRAREEYRGHPIITEPQCDNCGQRSRQTPCWKCEALSD